jgi:hypothetical protein
MAFRPEEHLRDLKGSKYLDARVGDRGWAFGDRDSAAGGAQARDGQTPVPERRSPVLIHPGTALERVCSVYGVTLRDILAVGREEDVNTARQMLMYLLHEHAHWPMTLIGRKLRRDHSTVFSAIQRVRERLAEQPHERYLYETYILAPDD